MLIYPAIDLMRGRCVRLSQGRFEDATLYGDPVAQIASFEQAGAQWAHVVDLDGARSGGAKQTGLIARLAASGAVKIQSGGGVRARADVMRLLDAGVSRVVVGSAAVKTPDQVAQWIAQFGAEKICCAFDVAASDGERYEVRVEGWMKGSGVSLDAALQALVGRGLRHALITDIARDGVLAGPNLALTQSVRRRFPDIALQASGGVASLDDLAALKETGASGAIVGRALYEKKFTLEEALGR